MMQVAQGLCQTQTNRERVEQGKLSGADERCQEVMAHLWGTFSVESLYDVIQRQFPRCIDEAQMAHVAQAITDLHCGGTGYTDADMAALLEPLLL